MIPIKESTTTFRQDRTHSELPLSPWKVRFCLHPRCPRVLLSFLLHPQIIKVTHRHSQRLQLFFRYQRYSRPLALHFMGVCRYVRLNRYYPPSLGSASTSADPGLVAIDLVGFHSCHELLRILPSRPGVAQAALAIVRISPPSSHFFFLGSNPWSLPCSNLDFH